jgi:hypothetical protein
VKLAAEFENHPEWPWLKMFAGQEGRLVKPVGSGWGWIAKFGKMEGTFRVRDGIHMLAYLRQSTTHVNLKNKNRDLPGPVAATAPAAGPAQIDPQAGDGVVPSPLPKKGVLKKGGGDEGGRKWSTVSMAPPASDLATWTKIAMTGRLKMQMSGEWRDRTENKTFCFPLPFLVFGRELATKNRLLSTTFVSGGFPPFSFSFVVPLLSVLFSVFGSGRRLRGCRDQARSP